MKSKQRFAAAAFAALVCGSGVGSSAATLNVPASYPTIQSAITAAVNGDTVLVAPGTYVGTVSFLGKGITVRSSQGAPTTIIQSPNASANVVSFTRGEPATAILDGFTIRGGNIGVNIATAPPSIRNCIITQNGTGMFLYFASPVIQGNTIVSNTPNGGIYFQGNGSGQIVGNNISHNVDTSAGGGAAMELFAAGYPTIRNNLISYNSAPSGGGGVITMVNISDALIEQNLIIRNESGNNGTIAWLAPSGANGARVINNTIAFNNSTVAAGIAADGYDATAQIINNIVYVSGTQTGIWVGGFNDPNLPMIRTNLVFSESGARYGGIAPDQTGINGNISANPEFTDVLLNDFHLRSTSPAIDVALASLAPAVDFAGLARPVDGDGDGVAAPDMGVFEFLGINHPPVAHAKTLEVAEDSSGTVQLSGTDQDGDALTFQVISNPAYGTISVNGANVTYTPQPNYNGSDSFTYIANDSKDNSLPATVSITITPVNDTPTAAGAAYTTAEDTARNLTLVAYDLDSDPLTWVIATPPQHGTLVGSGPHFTYTPASNFNGNDSFEFFVQDSVSASASATVSITVTPFNDVPVADPLALTLEEDTSLAIVLSGSDLDGDSLTFRIVSSPTHGTLSVSNDQLIYTPAANFNGSDEFTYVANDGTIDSAAATVSLAIQPVNDVPVANALALTLDEDSSLLIALNGSDVDGDSLSFQIASHPAHGTLSVSNGQLIYTPAANFNGSDEFTYVANDGTVDSTAATASLTVQSVNDVPVANAQSLSTPEDQSFGFTLTGTDADGDALTLRIVTPPAHGSLSVNGNTIEYVPEPNFNGTDRLEFIMSDGQNDSAAARIDIIISPVNDAPVANNGAFSGAEDSSIPIVLSGSDPDGDTLAFIVVAGPENGTLLGTGANLTYQPASNYNGGDSFTYKVNDGTTDSAVATVFVVVSPANDAPIATSRTVSVMEDHVLTSEVSGTDLDGDSLTFSLKEGPAHGTLVGQWPNFTYTPAPNYSGSDSFRFFVSDGTATSHGTISIFVSPVNDVPVAQTKSVSMHEDSSAEFSVTATDADGDSLNYSVLTQPLHGTLSGTGPQFVYTPAANFFGTDSFQFRASDGRSSSEPATVTITVNPVNDAPTFTLEGETLLARKNAGLQTYANWVQNLTAGPNEGGQIVSVAIINNNNPDLFEVQPALSANGTLTFNPRQGRTGSAVITVKALDNGGTADGGVDRSTQTFTIIVGSELSLQSALRPAHALLRRSK